MMFGEGMIGIILQQCLDGCGAVRDERQLAVDRWQDLKKRTDSDRVLHVVDASTATVSP